MISVNITPEANEAIVSEFKLRDLLEPALRISQQSPVADVSRSAQGQPEWTIERPQRLSIDFADLELPKEFALALPDYAKDKRRLKAAIVVDDIRLIIDRATQLSYDVVDIYLNDGELFVRGRSLLEPNDKLEARKQETK